MLEDQLQKLSDRSIELLSTSSDLSTDLSLDPLTDDDDLSSFH